MCKCRRKCPLCSPSSMGSQIVDKVLTARTKMAGCSHRHVSGDDKPFSLSARNHREHKYTAETLGFCVLGLWLRDAVDGPRFRDGGHIPRTFQLRSKFVRKFSQISSFGQVLLCQFVAWFPDVSQSANSPESYYHVFISKMTVMVKCWFLTVGITRRIG